MYLVHNKDCTEYSNEGSLDRNLLGKYKTINTLIYLIQILQILIMLLIVYSVNTSPVLTGKNLVFN